MVPFHCQVPVITSGGRLDASQTQDLGKNMPTACSAIFRTHQSRMLTGTSTWGQKEILATLGNHRPPHPQATSVSPELRALLHDGSLGGHGSSAGWLAGCPPTHTWSGHILVRHTEPGVLSRKVKCLPAGNSKYAVPASSQHCSPAKLLNYLCFKIREV